MTFKTCPACSERVRATAKKCQFCLRSFTARVSRAPMIVIAIGLVLAMGGAVLPVIAIAAAIMIVIGTLLAMRQHVYGSGTTSMSHA